MKNPATYRHLLLEVDSADRNGQLSNPVKHSEAVKLPYLCACIKEAMRLHPSVGLSMPRIVPKGGMRISGQFLPEGYRIGINAAVVHYDKSVFGDDAANFKPERWLESDASIMERYLLHFGACTRTCIRENVCLLRSSTVVSYYATPSHSFLSYITGNS